jgi:hypothetical protein
MYHSASRPGCHAVARPLERRVRAFSRSLRVSQEASVRPVAWMMYTANARLKATPMHLAAVFAGVESRNRGSKKTRRPCAKFRRSYATSSQPPENTTARRNAGLSPGPNQARATNNPGATAQATRNATEATRLPSTDWPRESRSRDAASDIQALRFLSALTFELSGGRRRGALAARRNMYHSASRPGCHAVGRPLERRVGRHCLGQHYGSEYSNS